MKKIIIFTALLFLLFSCTKECKQWYSHIRIYPITKENNNNEKLGDWYKTDFLNDELNFFISFIHSADGYEGCKSKTMIHEIVKDSTIIFCDAVLVIDNDSIPPRTNLKKYFKISEGSHYILEFNKNDFPFPKFENASNTFYVELKLTDNKVLSDSCIVKIN